MVGTRGIEPLAILRNPFIQAILFIKNAILQPGYSRIPNMTSKPSKCAEGQLLRLNVTVSKIKTISNTQTSKPQ